MVMQVQTHSSAAADHPTSREAANPPMAIVQGTFDGWFWAECRRCTWPGASHRDKAHARAEADRHNEAYHAEHFCSVSDRGLPIEESLSTAFGDYRAGSYDQTLVVLRKLLLDAGRKDGNGCHELSSARRELSIRALAFIAEIAPRPSRRETAAALMMAGALLGA